MTIKELEKILINEKIPRKDYEITGDNYLRGYDGYIILPAPKGKWELYYMERGQKDLLGTYPTDHACCIEFCDICPGATRSWKNICRNTKQHNLQNTKGVEKPPN